MRKLLTTPTRVHQPLAPVTPTSLPRSTSYDNCRPSSPCDFHTPNGIFDRGSHLDDSDWLDSDGSRSIRPLPKRQRTLEAQEPVHGESIAELDAMKSSGISLRMEEEYLEEVDDFPPVLSSSHEASKEYRTAETNGYHKGSAANHPPRIRPPLLTRDRSYTEAEELLHEFETVSVVSAAFIPGTSPSTFSGLSERPSSYFPVFGEAGENTLRSLSTASHFSSAGLFGGLGLSSLAPPVDRNNSGEDDEDEDGYSIARERLQGDDRYHIATAFAVDGQLGNNKKKRKIPGVNRGSNGEEDDRAFDGDDEIVPATSVDIHKNTHTNRRNETTSSEVIVPKAPPVVPTTAKAALAKLRHHTPHKSITGFCLANRRYALRYFKAYVALHKPLPLPAPVLYSAPASYSTGPPPLPPGSGLKGSKALKVAKKAEKDREKEKERMKIALGGGNIRLPIFWNPTGVVTPVKPYRSKGAEIRSGYITPAASDDGDSPPPRQLHLLAAPLTLDTFFFSSSPPQVVVTRWKALGDQIERFKVAKERALRAREEERERRKEKELEEAKEAAEVKKAPKKSPPGSKRGTPAAAQPPLALPPSADLPLSSSPQTKHQEILPPVIPNRKAPPKKGRKKRSAHANANNLHHVNNYVPSRMPASTNSHRSPHTDSNGATGPAPLTSWPASDEAIAAAAASRNSRGASYFAGADEFLCSFCDYQIFFGDSSSLAKAVEQRKKVLKVRKKAKERASKAANGVGGVPSPTAAPAPTPAPSPTPTINPELAS